MHSKPKISAGRHPRVTGSTKEDGHCGRQRSHFINDFAMFHFFAAAGGKKKHLSLYRRTSLPQPRRGTNMQKKQHQEMRDEPGQRLTGAVCVQVWILGSGGGVCRGAKL